jgi:hypothetical protein
MVNGWHVAARTVLLDRGEVFGIASANVADIRMETLGANLAAAGALCASFEQGVTTAAFSSISGASRWLPGCGKTAPGWEQP